MNTKRKFGMNILAVMAMLLMHYADTHAQQVLEYSRAAAGGETVGMTYWYTNSYTGPGGCRNSVEFLPAGFNFNDITTKYPLLIFLPGRNESINPFDNTNGGNKPENEKAPTLLSGSGYNIFSYTWPSIIKVQRLPIPNYLLTYYAPKDVTGPGGQLFSFIVVTVQCGQFDPIDDYEAFIRGYVFQKYKDKIDPRRIYITGLSLGGGKSMEFLAKANNADLVAAVAPVATGTECPYTPEYISTPGTLGPTGTPPVWSPCADQQGFTSIINHITARPQLGVFFNHNLADRSNAPAKISQFFFNALNNFEAGRAGGFFNNFVPTDDFDPAHDAWARAYDPFITDYNGQNMYQWFLNYQSNNALIPLPLVLRQFTATLSNGSAATLRWSTSLEKNTSHFEIERSTDGRNFNTIGKLNAAGDANNTRSYSYLDEVKGFGEVYYRLKMVDRDGRYEYSITRKLTLTNRGLQFAVSPNPFQSQVSLTIEGQARGSLQLSVYDQTGRLVLEETVRKEQENLHYRLELKVANGIYLLKVKGDNIDFTKRLIKQ